MGKILSIMRGPSGSGKSTHARMIKNAFEGAVVVSADNYFMHDGEYQFDPSRISQAYNDCFYKFLDAIDLGVEEIIVDNTNIHNWEFANYIKAGRMNGYEIEVVEFMATSVEDIKTCIYRNQHNVPAEVIMRMCCEFEPCFSQKNVTVHGIQKGYIMVQWAILHRGEQIDMVSMEDSLNAREARKVLIEEGYPECIKLKKA